MYAIVFNQIHSPSPSSRWGNPPIADARRFGHTQVVEYLEEFTRENTGESPPTTAAHVAPFSSLPTIQVFSPLQLSRSRSGSSSNLNDVIEENGMLYGMEEELPQEEEGEVEGEVGREVGGEEGGEEEEEIEEKLEDMKIVF